MIQEIDIYIIFGLILVFINTIFYFKKSRDIIENWFGSCGRDINRREDKRNTAKNNLFATAKILTHLQNKENSLKEAKNIQTDYESKLQEYTDIATKTLLESEKAIDQSQFTNSFISDEYNKNVYILGNVL